MFCFVTETETELNVEVAFSEQALSYRDNHQRSKVTCGANSPDDKLPVSHAPYLYTHTHKRTHSLPQQCVSASLYAQQALVVVQDVMFVTCTHNVTHCLCLCWLLRELSVCMNLLNWHANIFSKGNVVMISAFMQFLDLILAIY